MAFDNRKVAPGALFFCVPGFSSDGHDFAPAAVEAGAAALVAERELDLGVPEVGGSGLPGGDGAGRRRFNDEPTAELKMAGITGTNGKTTTAFLLRDILESAGRPLGPDGDRQAGGRRGRGGGRAGPLRRRSTSRPPSGGCSTPATKPA